MRAIEMNDVAQGDGCDARALQLQLYREIGLSAVEAALFPADQQDVPLALLAARHTPAIVVPDEKAA